jgi:hypothetical protein
LTKPGDSNDYKLWVARKQHVWRKIESLECAWAKVFDKHMCFINKLQKDRTATFIFKVKCNVALVSVDKFPPQAFTVAWVAPRHAAQRITGVWSLDLDDVCSEVGEVTGTVWASQHCRDVDYSNIRKWWVQKTKTRGVIVGSHLSHSTNDH